jgi:NADPH-dependent 2,4-dienoyl-CoA reductase/sulfur reductase-like enzyme
VQREEGILGPCEFLDHGVERRRVVVVGDGERMMRADEAARGRGRDARRR